MNLKILLFFLIDVLFCYAFSGDPYKTLGVSRNADQYEIKRAYKHLAKKWHPDRSKSADAEGRFMQVADAYQLLSDPVKKENYDRYGDDEPPGFQNAHHYSGGGQQFFFRSSDGVRFTFHGGDPFEHFHQDFFGRRQRHRPERDPLGQRIWNKIKSLPQATLVLFGLENGVSWTSGLIAVGAIIGCGVLFRLMDVDRSDEAAAEDARVRQPSRPTKWLHEMTLMTYDGLLRLQKPGCRTLILLVDTETQRELLKEFSRAVYPYKNHKSLMFGYLNLDKFMHWYIRLLRSTPDCEGRPLDVELKSCLGTVLVLNNFKHCFSVFHTNVTKVPPKEDQYGFSSSSDSDESDVEAGVHRRKGKRKDQTKNADSSAVKLRLLEGLPNFLERLFDGQIPKFQVPSWPSMK